MEKFIQKKEFIKKRSVITLILIFCYIIAYLARKGASYISPYLLEMYGATKMDWANLVAMTSAGYGVGKFILPYIADKAKKNVGMLGCFSILSGLLTICMGLSGSWLVFLCFFIAMCFFQGNALPNSVGVICKWYKKEDRSVAYTVWSASHKIGLALSGVLASVLVARNLLSGNFYIPGILSILVGITILVWGENKPKQEWQQFVHLEPAEIANDSPSLDFRKNVYFNPRVIKVCIVAFFSYLAYTVMADMGTLIFVEKGFERVEAIKIIVSFSSLAFLGGFLCSITAKKLFKDKVIKTVKFCFILMSIAFIAMSFVSKSWSVPLILAFMAVAGMLCDVIQIMPGVISTLCCPTSYSATATGYVGIWQQVGVIICAYTSGALLTYVSPNSALYMAAGGCLIGAALLQSLQKSEDKT
jgi:OPA family sugar phosphate sensor protein UhpC-like MFS transporter